MHDGWFVGTASGKGTIAMSVKIEFLDGDRSGEVLTFDDTVEQIVIGRDPEQCQVVLPPDMRMVGREHCTITRVRGHYYMEMGADRRVMVNDSLMDTSQALQAESTLQIGPEGPMIKVMCVRGTGLASTLQQGIDTEVMRRREATPASAVDVESVRTTARQGSQVAAAALVLAFVVLIVGGTWYWWLGDDVEELEFQQGQNTRSVNAIQGAVGSLSDDVTNLGSGMSDALDDARHSTYIVIRRSESGLEEPFGTAWVLGPDRLATNAHVAEHLQDLREGQSIIVRSTGGTSEFPVVGSTVHPGYNSFTELWREYVPVQINAAKESDPIRAAGMAADVGILHVPEGSNLGTPLQLADQDSQLSLRPGDTVGYVGFPVEHMALGGVNLMEPVPQTQVGNITAITDYFNAPAPDGNGLLIQHSLPATGGASGAPLINARGEVVGLLSAVNFIVVGGERIPSGVDVNFAQRATLLNELESNDLGDVQQVRTAKWQDRINTLYASGRVANRSPELEDVIASWEQMVAFDSGEVVMGSEPVASELFPLDSLQIDAFAMGAGDALGEQIYGRSIELEVQAGTNYLLTVEGNGDVVADMTGNDVRIVNVMNIKPRLKAIAFRAEQSGTIKANIGTTARTGTLGYQLRSAKMSTATPEAVAENAMRRWLQDLARRDGQDLDAKLIRQWTGVLASKDDGHAEDSHELELDAAGRWFVVAVCMDFDDINLQVKDRTGNMIAEDRQPDWYPFVAVETRSPQSMKAIITSPHAKSAYRLYLYQATDKSES